MWVQGCTYSVRWRGFTQAVPNPCCWFPRSFSSILHMVVFTPVGRAEGIPDTPVDQALPDMYTRGEDWLLPGGLVTD